MQIGDMIKLFCMKLRKCFLACLLVLMSIGAQSMLRPVLGQGTSNITVIGIPPIIKKPFTAQFKQNFQNGRYQVIFNYINPTNNHPIAFSFQFTLTRNGEQILQFTSNLEKYTPGTYVYTSIFDELTFPISASEIIDRINSNVRNQIIQGGSLPEGNYVLYIKAIPSAQPGLVTSMQSVTPFTVRFPMAPVLIVPAEGANLTLQTPLFSWTPVLAAGITVEYNFLLVEVLPNQTPIEAINANEAYAKKTFTVKNTFIYTPEFIPLEDGHQYAWQITASSIGGGLPIKNEGESEINTFVYNKLGMAGAAGNLENLEELPLIPDFATLTALTNLQATENANTVTFNGTAQLELKMLTGVKRIKVKVNNLEIQKGSIEAPVLVGGEVGGKAESLSDLLTEQTQLLSFTNLNWKLGSGITVQAKVNGIGSDEIQMEGDLKLRRDGLYGTLSASGSPLLSYGDELINIKITELSTTYPGGVITAEGAVELLGQPTGCEVTGFAIINNKLSTLINCDSSFSVPLVDDSDFAKMEVHRISGLVGVNPETQVLDYRLELATTAGLKTEAGNLCGTDATVILDKQDGFSLMPGVSSCEEVEPKIDLGFITLTLTQTQLNKLDYNSATGKLDFELKIGAEFEVPSFGAWQSFGVDNILIDELGIHFPHIAFVDELQELPEYTVNDYIVKIEDFIINKFTLPIFTWDRKGPGPWDLSFAGKVTVPNTSFYPTCIRGNTFALSGGHVEGDEVYGTVRSGELGGNCSFVFGAGYKVNVNEFTGRFGVKYEENNDYSLVGQLNVDGDLKLGTPFVCETGESTTLPNGTFTFTNGLNGTIENIIPECEITVGPFKAQISDSKLAFSLDENGEQLATMAADANLILPEGRSVTGTFDLDMITGEFTDLLFELNDPFLWEVPQNDPVLTFEIQRATITEDGFNVNGRSQLILGQENTIGVTFDNLNLDLQTRHVKQGRVLFDEAFALAAAINPDDMSLDFEAVEIGDRPQQTPALYMELAGQLAIDTLGLHADGSAAASVMFNGEIYGDSVSVEFSNRFTLNLFPFEVGSGQANFNYKGTRFAFADPSGFHVDEVFFGEMLIPEIIPLPDENIAYIRLRQDGELLVNVEENENGDYVISTKPGEPLTLYAPIFNTGTPNPPELTNVLLNDVVISGDPARPGFLSGTIEVEVPQNNPLYQLKKKYLPLNIRKIVYGIREVEENPTEALYLLGDLFLFDRDLIDAPQAAFYIQRDGIIRGSLDLKAMDAQIPVVPNEMTTLLVDEFKGTFTLDINAETANYDFNLKGGLGFDGQTAATFNIAISPGVFHMSDFQSKAFVSAPELDFGRFGLRLNAITTADFDYTRAGGFDFALGLDAALRITLADGQDIVFPIRSLEEPYHYLEIRDEGIDMPPLTINSSSIPGLELPAFTLQGFELKPIELKTGAYFFNWSSEAAFTPPDVNMKFALTFPNLETFENLNIPDGLTVEVGFDNGYLSGTVTPFSPLGGILIPLVPGNPNSPKIRLSELYGALSSVPDETGEVQQLIDINIEGNLEDLPIFSQNETGDCAINAPFKLAIVDGAYFKGDVSVDNICGSLQWGPVQLTLNSAGIRFNVSDNVQRAVLDGSATATLPSPVEGQNISATGDISIDLFTGAINDGSIQINQPFALNLPFEAETPLFKFTVNSALLNRNGFMINGSGSLKANEIDVNVQFEDLTFGFDEFAIVDGTATIDPDIAVKVGISPLGISFVDPAAEPANNALNINLNTDLILSSTGLALNGTADAQFIFMDENYASIRVEFRDSFTFNTGGVVSQVVNEGEALFYDISEDPTGTLLAKLNESGFDFLGLAASVLPDTIPLPSEDIAYIVIKDDTGNLLVDVEENDSNGYTIKTKTDESLEIVVPALADASETPRGEVTFTLTTDDAYNITGGTLTLSGNIDLEPTMDLPITITKLAIDDSDGMKLTAGLRVELPSFLNQRGSDTSTADIEAIISNNGLESATLVTENYVTSYDSYDIEKGPLYSYSYPENQENGSFNAALLGIKLALGNTNEISIAGTLSSSLIMDVDAADGSFDDPIFFTAGYVNSAWKFEVDSGELGEYSFGMATLDINKEDGIQILADENSFYVSLNGTVSLEDVLEEPIELTVLGLEVGVDNLDSSSPSIHFELAEASGSITNQTFSLFENAFVVEIPELTLGLNGTALTLSSPSGTVTFIEKSIDYTNLTIDTEGNFSFDSFALEDDIAIIDNHLWINELALINDATNGLTLAAGLKVTLPDPFHKTAEGEVKIYRDTENTIHIDSPNFTFNTGERFTLGSFAEFKLTKVGLNLGISNDESLAITANGELYLENEEDPIVYFGEPETPGLRISTDGAEFHVNQNKPFTFGRGFFNISVKADEVSADLNSFTIRLSGEASVNLGGATVNGTLGYEGFVLNETGVKDWGNLNGSGELDLAGIGTITIGKYYYEKFEEGETISIVDTSPPSDIEKLRNDTGAVPTKNIEVTELMCFGPCPVEGYNNTSKAALNLSIDALGVSGGVESIFYYKTADENMLSIKGALLKIDTYLEMTAQLEYMTADDGDYLLRAAATGTFAFGDDGIKAAIAGKFASVDGKDSYGLFVAAQSETGIPIVPGIVTLKGVGAGFFYNPVEADLKMVHDAAEDLGGGLIIPEVSSMGGFTNDEMSFAAMLYGSVDILGAGAGEAAISGNAYIEVTSNNFTIAAHAAVLGLDGDGSFANTSLTGNLDLTVIYDPMFITGGLSAELVIPSLVEGTTDIEFFVKEATPDNFWGIIGSVELEVLDGALSGDAEFLASNDGMMLTAGLGFDIDVPVITLKAEVKASLWMLDGDKYELPIGVYATFKAEACLGFCASVNVKAAAAYKNPGFALYGAASACVDLILTEGCLAVWAAVEDGDMDAGFGESSQGNLIARAKAQRDAFKASIEEIKAKIEAIKAELEEPKPFPSLNISAEDIKKAGANLYTASSTDRHNQVTHLVNTLSLATTVQSNTNQYGITSSHDVYPQGLWFLMNDILLSEPRWLLSVLADKSSDVKQSLTTNLEEVKTQTENMTGVLDNTLQQSIQSVEEAKEAFDNLLQNMAESPVEDITRINVPILRENITYSPTFAVNQEKAMQQAQNAEALDEALRQMDLQFRASIASVDSVLKDMHALTTTIRSNGASIDRLLGLYAKTLSSSQKYYVFEKNELWFERGWALKKRKALQSHRIQINNDIDNLNETFANLVRNRVNGDDDADYETATKHLVQRLQLFYSYRDNSLPRNMPSVSGSPYYDYLMGDHVSAETAIDSVARVNQIVWYDMHNEGLKYYAEIVADMVPNITQMQQQELSGFTSLYKDITGVVNNIYDNQATLTAILYNMINNYLEWKGNFNLTDLQSGNDGSTNGYQLVQPVGNIIATIMTVPIDYERRLQNLSDALKPPQITTISVDPNRISVNGLEFYYSTVDIEWNATHPIGLVESSIDIKLNEQNTANYVGSITEALSDYMSVGNEKSFTSYVAKSSPGNNSTTLNIGVRVRGSAGNTAIRRATAQIQTGPEGEGILNGGGSVNVLQEDNTAPKILPTSPFDANYEKSNKTVTVNGNPVESKAYWTNNSVLNLSIRAMDNESGISQHKYAIGTWQGATDVLDWTELHGEDKFIVGWNIMEGRTIPLDMSPGQPYYISVMVTNGEGIMTIKKFSIPIRFDATPPSLPIVQMGVNAVVGVARQAMPFRTFGNYTPQVPVDPLLTDIPRLTVSNDERQKWKNTEVPSVTLTWPEYIDGESGMADYEYIVNASAEAVPADFINANRTYSITDRSFEYTGDRSGSLLEDYDTELYLHIRAIDVAGNASEIYTMTPGTPKDPTAPFVGRIQAKVYPMYIYLYLMELPYDPETDLRGIQYSIGSTPGATDLRSWPEGDNVDFNWSLQDNQSGRQRSFRINSDELPSGNEFYINYRVVNTRGMKSKIRSTGSIYLDFSRPEGVVDISYSTPDSKLTIDINNIEDAESGIASVKYTVTYPEHYYNQPSVELIDQTVIKHGEFDLTKSITLDSSLFDKYTDVRVYVTITNGTTLSKSFVKTLTDEDVFNAILAEPSYDFLFINY